MMTNGNISVLKGGAAEFVPGRREHFELDDPFITTTMGDRSYDQMGHNQTPYGGPVQQPYYPALHQQDTNPYNIAYVPSDHPTANFPAYPEGDFYYTPQTGPWYPTAVNTNGNGVQPMNGMSHADWMSGPAYGNGAMQNNGFYDGGEDSAMQQYGQQMATSYGGGKGKHWAKNYRKKGKHSKKHKKNGAGVFEEQLERVEQMVTAEGNGGKNHGW